VALNNDVPIYAVARNMGTTMKIIESYYGKGATASSMASMLGGKVKLSYSILLSI